MELPVGDPDVAPENEGPARCWPALERTARAWCTCCIRWTGCRRRWTAGTHRGHRRGEGVLHKRACPVCGTSYPELDPRMFSYNSKHGWCTTCVGTGLTLTREQRKAYDDSSARRRPQGPRAELPAEEPEVEGVGRPNDPAPIATGTRLNPRGARRSALKMTAGRSQHRRRLSVSARRGAGSRADARGPAAREAGIARDVVPEIRSASLPGRGRSGAT